MAGLDSCPTYLCTTYNIRRTYHFILPLIPFIPLIFRWTLIFIIIIDMSFVYLINVGSIGIGLRR